MLLDSRLAAHLLTSEGSVCFSEHATLDVFSGLVEKRINSMITDCTMGSSVSANEFSSDMLEEALLQDLAAAEAEKKSAPVITTAMVSEYLESRH